MDEWTANKYSFVLFSHLAYLNIGHCFTGSIWPSSGICRWEESRNKEWRKLKRKNPERDKRNTQPTCELFLCVIQTIWIIPWIEAIFLLHPLLHIRVYKVKMKKLRPSGEVEKVFYYFTFFTVYADIWNISWLTSLSKKLFKYVVQNEKEIYLRDFAFLYFLAAIKIGNCCTWTTYVGF